MKKVSFARFVELIQERREANGLRSLDLQPVTFLHDLSTDPDTTLDLLEEVTQALKINVNRETLKTDYLSPYLRYNLQDLYDSFVRIQADRAYNRYRKVWYSVGFVLAGFTLYEFFVEVAILQCILLATITSAIFQYLHGGKTPA